ncbi:MAG: NFACT RNA binding domain-containing protein [Candidatus Nanoarchaeia archaeon]
MKFREFISSTGKKILAGKSAENNEELVEQVDKDELVLHTKEPGSPFVNIKGSPSKQDVNDAAIICAKYSQAWKKRQDVIVQVFKGKDIYKKKDMKTGTFGVRSKKEIKVKKADIEKFEKDMQQQDAALDKLE